MARVQYAMKRVGVSERREGFMEGVKMCKMIQGGSSLKSKGQIRLWTEYERWCPQIE
jgi:hypothetical protein